MLTTDRSQTQQIIGQCQLLGEYNKRTLALCELVSATGKPNLPGGTVTTVMEMMIENLNDVDVIRENLFEIASLERAAEPGPITECVHDASAQNFCKEEGQ